MSFWDQLLEGLESIGNTIAEWAPKILVALLVLVVGRWILRLIRRWTEKLLSVQAVQGVFDRAGVTRALAPGGRSPASLFATILYAFLMVGLWLVVFRILELETIVDLLERLLAWVPQVILAAVVIIIAAAVANWAADLVQPFGERRGVPWVAAVVRILIVIFGVLFAMDLLDMQFASEIANILTAAFGIAFAVAFGVGGIDTAKKWWERYLAPRERGPGGAPPPQ